MQTLRAWPVLGGGLALLAGVGLGTWLNPERAMLVFIAGAAVAVLGAVAAARHWSALLGLASVGLLIVAGYGYALARTVVTPQLTVETELSETRALVVSDPEQADGRTRAYLDLTLNGRAYRLRATWTELDAAVYGDIVQVSGVALPARVEPDFSERGYLLAHRAHGTLRVESLVLTGERGGSRVLDALHQIRRWLLARLDTALPLPAESIVGGILLGEQGGLPKSIEADFRATGTTHILVVSGSNVLVLATVVRLLCGWLGRRWSALLAAVVLGAFVIITGGDASVVRATLFFLLILLAEVTGRRIHAPTLVTVVALGMALLTPWVLLYDIAFQLSFAATLGLLLFAPWFAELLPGWLLPEYLAPTLAAELMTLPVLIYHFGQASLVGPVANVLVLPTVPAIMAGGVLTLLVPWLSIIGWATEGLVQVVLLIVAWLGAVPMVDTSAYRYAWTVGAVALVLGVSLLQHWNQRRTREQYVSR